MPISADFSIDYNNKRIYHSAGTTLYTVNELYTYLMSTFDDLTQMDDSVPITAQTPTEYTLVNGWFMDDDSIKYLYGGAIQTSGWGSGVIRKLSVSASGYTSPIATDIGKTVTGGTTGHTGILLAYNADESGNYEWYVRPTDPATDLFNNGSETYTISGGTGTGTAADVSSTGETLWANIYTLGTITTDPYALMYVKRGDTEIINGYIFENTRADGNNWWNVGHIDVLLKVKNSDTLLENGEVTVYGRQFGDLYDQFTIDLSNGGRNAVPLATSTDLDNSTGSHYLLYDAEVTPPVVGEIVDNGGTFRAEVFAVTDWGTSGLLELGNVIVGDLADNDTLNGSIGGTGLATVNGTLGDTYFEYSAEAAPLTVGNVITGGTSGATRIVRGIQDDGTTGKVISQVQSSAPSTDYLAFSAGETVTDTGTGSVTVGASDSITVVSGFSDIQIWFVNHKLWYGGLTGTFQIGETVTQAVTGASGIVVEDTGTTLMLANRNSIWFDTTNTITGSVSGATATPTTTGYPTSSISKAFQQQAPSTYKIIVDCAGRPLSEMYAYFKYITGDGSNYLMNRTTDAFASSVKMYDATGATYTDNTAAATSFTTGDIPIFDADPEVGDIVYISSDETFAKIEIILSTAGVGTWTVTWEYWNGTTWTALPGIGLDGVAGDAPGLHYRAVGESQITWDMPGDWATTTVDGVLGYYIRGRISSFTSVTTNPVGDYFLLGGPQKTVAGKVYSEAHYGYVPVKAAPFGTFAGGTYFGARGVWIENMAASDVQSYQLKDAGNTTQTPPNFQTIVVTNLVAGDTVAVFRTSAGSIDKALYSMTAQGAGASTITVGSSIATDTPTSGKVRVVDTATNTEQRYRFSSWSGSVFTLVSGATGSATAGSTGQTLIDSAADFGGADNVEAGDVIRNTTTGESGVVISVDSATQLTTSGLTSGWTSGDAYDTNLTDRAYTISDTVYVPFLDLTATSTSESVTVIYSADRPILTRVRRYNGAGDSILPFETAGTFGSTGYSVATIRTDDAIVA